MVHLHMETADVISRVVCDHLAEYGPSVDYGVMSLVWHKTVYLLSHRPWNGYLLHLPDCSQQLQMPN